VGIAVCDRIAAPVLVGILRPMIVLPAAAVCGWSTEQLEMALLHELAHIRRHDNLITLVQRFAESLLFFHPVAWWLSAWISLEREVCCDRLVVEHTGRPQAYARMLAAFAGVNARVPSMALAMAQRPLATRIRRILNVEDRSMKMTLTEGLGLLAAAIAGTAMTLAACAMPPEDANDGAARQNLERLAQRVIALPDGFEDYKGAGQAYDGKGLALIEIARAQLKLGDRAAALATIERLDSLAGPVPQNTGAKAGIRDWTRFASLAESAKVRRDAGDAAGARAVLERAARQLNILDDGAIHGAIEQAAKQFDSAIAAKADGPIRLNDEEAAFAAEASVVLIDQYIALGDMAKARSKIRRLIAGIGSPRGPVRVAFLAALGGYLNKAGDTEGSRDVINQARQAVLAISDPQARTFALPIVAQSLFEAGKVDEALALLRELSPQAQPAAFARIVEEFTTDDHSSSWLDLAGIAIKIGNPSLKPKDPAAARTVLPKVAAVVRASGDVRGQARTLAIVAHLQARAGDFAGALATARSIPDLKRSDFPGPSDGFYDAVKPVTLALIAGVQFQADSRSDAAATLAEAQSLTRVIADDDQKLIAEIVIAQKEAACGRRDAAKAIVAEATPLAMTQPEPRRSRGLAMLTDAQVKAGDTDGAERTIDAIREYPGLEKARALSTLASWHEEAGDRATSAKLLARAIPCLESKAPDKPLPGKLLTLAAFSRDTFIDYDLELNPGMVQFQREMMLRRCLTNMGNFEAAVRQAKALPPVGRDIALTEIAGNLAVRGEVGSAMDLVAAIASPDARLRAFVMLAGAIPEHRTTK
jgi:hypothetical protein